MSSLSASPPPPLEPLREEIGQLAGHPVYSFTFSNASGIKVTVLEAGAILASVITPDKNGHFADITLGYDQLEDWQKNLPYHGATVGRFANRIDGGKFTLDGKIHQLPINNEPANVPSSLHGGIFGFDKKHWSGKPFIKDDSRGVTLTYTSPDGEEGYPGTLTTEVTYTLTDDNELLWEARSTTNAPTIINLVNHTYWNLSGDRTSPILDHEVKIFSDSFLPSTPGLIPTGEISPIAFTPLDFTEFTRIGDRIDAPFLPLEEAAGYDQAFLLDNGGKLKEAAIARDPASGRSLSLSTNQPAVHFYSGNYIDSHLPGKGGEMYSPRCGFCLETENYPDAPNNPKAPSPILRPGESYYHIMKMKFGW